MFYLSCTTAGSWIKKRDNIFWNKRHIIFAICLSLLVYSLTLSRSINFGLNYMLYQANKIKISDNYLKNCHKEGWWTERMQAERHTNQRTELIAILENKNSGCCFECEWRRSLSAVKAESYPCTVRFWNDKMFAEKAHSSTSFKGM